MSKKITPAIVTVVCDCCLKDVGSPGVTRAHNAGIHVARDALDYQGAACAGANITMDLCDSCLELVSAAVNDVAVRVRVAT